MHNKRNQLIFQIDPRQFKIIAIRILSATLSVFICSGTAPAEAKTKIHKKGATVEHILQKNTTSAKTQDKRTEWSKLSERSKLDNDTESERPKWELLRTEATDAINKKDYKTAIQKLNDALSAVQSSKIPEPDFLQEFHQRLAIVYLQQGSLDQADKQCDEALAALVPIANQAGYERACILNNASVISSKKKQYDKASLQSKEALEVITKAAPARYALVEIKVNSAVYSLHSAKADDFDNALKQAQDLPKDYMNNATALAANLIVEGLHEYAIGHVDNALNKFAEAKDVTGLDSEGLPQSVLLVAENNLAVVLAKTGKLDDASKLLESADKRTLNTLDDQLIKRNQTKLSSFSAGENKTNFDSLNLELLDPTVLVLPERARGRRILYPRPAG